MKIVHQLPVPQSIANLTALCGLPAATVKNGDNAHQFALTDRPEDVTCIGCLAVRQLAELAPLIPFAKGFV